MLDSGMNLNGLARQRKDAEVTQGQAMVRYHAPSHFNA